MRKRDEPWKWPVAIGLALTLTMGTLLALPRAWLGFLLPAPGGEIAAGDRAQPWLELLPPPVVEVVPDPDAPPPRERVPARDLAEPAWWTGARVAAPRDDRALFAPPAADADTVGLVLAALGVGADLWARTRSDSVLAARLALLRITDALAYDELEPLLPGLARAEAYADILSKAADMYDEPLAQEIRVPD